MANEAAYLYAPLAHKLGLYKLKSELEDLSLKYTEKEVYYHIMMRITRMSSAKDSSRLRKFSDSMVGLLA